MKNTNKNYEVTLYLVVNASRDMDLDTPQTKRVEYIVSANSEEQARRMAIEIDDSKLPVWESYIFEI
jgi:hypothetical protein